MSFAAAPENSVYPGIEPDELVRLQAAGFPDQKIAELSHVRASGLIAELERQAGIAEVPHRDRSEYGALVKFLERMATRYGLHSEVRRFLAHDAGFHAGMGPEVGLSAVPQLPATGWNGLTPAALVL